MRKRRFLFSTLFLAGAAVALGLSACNRPTPENNSNPNIGEKSHQELMFNTLLETRNLDANLDVDLKYRDYEFDIKGKAYVTLDTISDIKANLDLTVDMPNESAFKLQTLKATYLDSTFYLNITNRKLKLHTDNLNDILELFTSETTGEEVENSSPSTLKTTHLADLLRNIGSMTADVSGEQINYTVKTWSDYPDVHFTTDLNHKLTSMSMENIVAGDFTFSFNFTTSVLDIPDDRVTSPESEENPYIDVSNYLGAFGDIKDIVNDEHVSLAYELDCTRYDDPVASTEGVLSFDFKDFIVQLAGDVHIGDYTGKYDARYDGNDEAVYLNFDETFKLSYSNQGLGDLWKILDDKEVFPVSIFDLLWGASGKVYPILDIIEDGHYLDLLNYFEKIDLDNNYVSLTLDNKVWGGEGKFDLKVNFDKDHITSIVFDNLDINDYKVNVTFTLTDYAGIKALDKENYSSLDGLDKILKNTMPIINAKQIGLGLDVDVTNAKDETFSAEGLVQLDWGVLKLQTSLMLKDFSDNRHNILLSTYKDAESKKDYVCAAYTFKDSNTNSTVRAKTSYDSIGSVFNAVMGIMNRTSCESNPDLDAAVPVVAETTITTLTKVMGGDYVAILKDKAIKQFSINDGNYTLLLDKEALGLADDLSLVIHTSEGKLTTADINTKFQDYTISAVLTLKDYDKELAYVNEGNFNTYFDCSSLSNLAQYLVDTSQNGKFPVVDQIMKLINEKKVGLTFSGEILKGGEDFLAVENMNANIALKDGEINNILNILEGVISGDIKYTAGGVTESAPFTLAAQGDTFSFNFNDAVAIKCDRDGINDIVGLINKLSGGDSQGLSTSLQANTLPILQYLNDKDYQSILKLYKGSTIEEGELKLSLSNGLFNQNDTTDFDLIIKLGEKGLESFKVTNLKYGEFTLNLNLGVKDYAAPAAIDTSSYVDVSRIVTVYDQLEDLLASKKGHLDIDVTYGDYKVVGTAQVDIEGKAYHIDLIVTIGTDTHHIKLENVDGYYYVKYNDSYAAKASETSVNSVIADVIAMVFDKDSAVGELVSTFIGGDNNQTSSTGLNVDVVGLLFEDGALTLSETDGVINANVDGTKFGLTGNIIVKLGFNDDDTLHYVDGSLTYNSTPVSAKLTLEDYDDEYRVFSETEMTTTEWTDATKAVTVVEYVTSLNKQTQKAVIDQVKDLLEAKKASFSYTIDAYTKNGNTKKVIVDTTGLVKLDFSDIDNLAAELAGTLYVRNDTEVTTDDYETTYRFNYANKTLYLALGNNLKLSIEQSSIKSLLAAITSLLPTDALNDVNNVSETTMPILSMINNGEYIKLLNYISDARYEGGTLIIDINNTLIGGSGTSVFTIVAGENGLASISIVGLNYSKYYLDLNLAFEDYQDIETIETTAYRSLDDLGSVLTSGVDYYNGKEYALGLTATLSKGTGAELKTLSLTGDAQLNMKDGLTGGMNISLTDFDGHVHALLADTYKDETPEPDVDFLALDYTYKASQDAESSINVNGKASYKSIIDIYNTIKDALSDNSSSGEEQNQLLSLITPILGDITGTTLDKVLNGNYIAIIEDEMFKEFSIDGNKYTMVIKGASFNLSKDITFEMWTKDVANTGENATGTHKELDKLRLDASLLGYDADITLQLKSYDSTKRYIPLATMQAYSDKSNLSTLVRYIKDEAYNGGGASLDSFGFIGQIMDILEDKQLGINFSGLTLKQKNETTGNYDLLYTLDSGSAHIDFNNTDHLFLKLQGTITDHDETPHSLSFSAGIQPGTAAYDSEDTTKDYLHLKIGNSVKAKIQTEKLSSILSKITGLLGSSSSSSSSSLTSLNTSSLPVMNYISTSNYQALLNSIKGITVTEENDKSVLNLVISNSLFRSGDESSFTLSADIDTAGLNSIKVENLHFQDYAVAGTIGLIDFNNTKIDTTGYCDLSSIDVAIDQFLDMLDTKTFHISTTDAVYGQYTLSADINARLYPNSQEYKDYKAELNELLAKEEKTAADNTRIAELQSLLADPVYQAELTTLLAISENDRTSEQTARIAELQEHLYNEIIRYGLSATLVDSKNTVETTDDKTYTLKIENDGINLYIVFDSTKMVIPSSEVDDVIGVIKGMLDDDTSILYDYAGGLINMIPGLGTSSSSEQSSSDGIDLIDFIFNERLKTFTYTTTNESATGTLTAVVDKDALDALMSDATLNIVINKADHKVTELNANTSIKDGENTNALNAAITIGDYDPSIIYVTDKTAVDEHDVPVYTSLAGVGTAVKYLDNLGADRQRKIIDEVQDLMDNKKASLTYELSITKTKGGASIVDASGQLNVDLTNINDLFNTTISLQGDLTKGGTINLNSTYDLRLVDGVAYFSFSHDATSNFKVKYTLTTLKDLKTLLYNEADTNPTLKAFLDSIFPDDGSNASPLSSALASGDYLSLIKYYVGAYVDRGILYISLDGKMIGSTGTINIGFDTNDYGINSIYVNDFYALGYYLSGKVTFNYNPTSGLINYVIPTVPANYNEYVTLDHINDIAEDLIDLFSDTADKTVAYRLDATFGDMIIGADARFILNTEGKTLNKGNLNVVFTSGKRTHYVDTYIEAQLYQNTQAYKDIEEALEAATDPDVIADLEEQKQAIIDDANDNSQIHVAYGDVASVYDSTNKVATGHGDRPAAGDMMYANLTLGTVMDVYNIFQELTSGDNARFANIMEMFSSNGPQSVFNRILSGEIEAFLYNKIFKSFSYNDSTQTYTIVVNGDIFNAEGADSDSSVNSDLTLTLQTADKAAPATGKYIKSVGLNGKYGKQNVNVALSAVDYVAPSTIEVPSGKTEYDFSSVDDLVNHLLHTVEQDDFVFTGDIKLNGKIAGFSFTNKTMPVEAYVKITQDEFGYENYRAKISFSNIPMLRFGALGMYYNVSDDRDMWTDGERTFYIYLKNQVVYDENNEPLLDENGDVVRDSVVCLYVDYYNGSTHKIKRKTLSLVDFTDDLTYYLLNFGLGIKARNNSLPSDYPEDVMEDANGNPVNKDQDFLNFHNYHEESEYMATYSKLLTAYNYTKATDGSVWEVSIDLEELLNNSMLNDANLAILGSSYVNENNEIVNYLSRIYGSTAFNVTIASLSASVDLTYAQGTEVPTATINEIDDYITQWKSIPRATY